MTTTDRRTDAKPKGSTRAKSCNACRQAKAKCDLRARSPAPCSRCEKLGQKCRTDAAFQRVGTRSRIKALEAQVDELHRSQAAEAPSKPPGAGHGSEVVSSPLQSQTPAHVSSTLDDGSHGQWYSSSILPSQSSFVLHDCILSWKDVNELYLYFSVFHLPHCSFLIPIHSLKGLNEDDELLFWTIVLIAARHHRRHHRMNQALETAHSRLRADKCSEAIRKLPDLQAVLLLCMWPLPVKSQDGDTAGLRLAEALSGVRQMGLDTKENEILSGIPRAAKRLQQYSARTVRLTWLKCFELDVQLSLWHGTLPALAASRYFKSVTDACLHPDVPRAIAQNIDMHVQMARYLLLLDDISGTDAAWNLAKTSLQSLNLSKESKRETWTLENDLILDTFRAYICMTTYVHLSGQRKVSHDNGQVGSLSFCTRESLLEAKDGAISIIRQLCALTDNAMSKDQSPHAGTTGLPGFPKNAARLMFFATSVLLKYISSVSEHTSLFQEKKASDAFEKALRFFYCCPKSTTHIMAGRTLEDAGREILHHRHRLGNHVLTRLGASVMHDVRWLSAVIRGHDRDPMKSRASTPANEVRTDAKSPSIENDNLCGMTEDAEDNQWTDWCYSGTEMLPSSMDLPAFEMWDHVLDGVSQDDFNGQTLSHFGLHSS